MNSCITWIINTLLLVGTFVIVVLLLLATMAMKIIGSINAAR